MYQGELWKYCTTGHCRDMLLSLGLVGDGEWPDEKVISCLYAVSNYPEKHYQETRIPKRNGGKRRLYVPDSLLKGIQKNILHHALDGMEISGKAFAYRKGVSLLAGARVHTGQPVLLKLDIRDFFGSILFPAVLQNAFPLKYYPPAVGTLLASLCCRMDCLPQGAPTSPAISNLVMKPFDLYMDQWCMERNIVYTRYCDDMTFSGDFRAEDVRRKVKGFLGAMGMELNEGKTRVIYQGSRQMVTGLVVNEKLSVPSQYRRRLRQEIYYCLKFGPEAHFKRTSADHEGVEGLSQGEIKKHLASLMGKIDFVLQTSPGDAWFVYAREEIKKLLMAEG